MKKGQKKKKKKKTTTPKSTGKSKFKAKQH
jgi:hypothetical protein